jgi:hypothetical protein
MKLANREKGKIIKSCARDRHFSSEKEKTYMNLRLPQSGGMHQFPMFPGID